MYSDVLIRRMVHADIGKLAATFVEWGKTIDKFSSHWEQRQRGSRHFLVADVDAAVVGYVSVVWQSAYGWFARQDIPEIVDLSVMTGLQGQGIGTRLILAAEESARDRSKPMLGISVQQSPEFAAAQRLYLTLGCVPDGRGITPHDNELHLIKVLVAEGCKTR